MTISSALEPFPSATATDASAIDTTHHHQIVIVGGGAAGITTASQLLAKDKSLDIAIVEPSDKHYYQPGGTLVGGGIFKLQDTVQEEKDCIPKAATWIQDYVTQLDPDSNTVIIKLRGGNAECMHFIPRCVYTVAGDGGSRGAVRAVSRTCQTPSHAPES